MLYFKTFPTSAPNMRTRLTISRGPHRQLIISLVLSFFVFLHGSLGSAQQATPPPKIPLKSILGLDGATPQPDTGKSQAESVVDQLVVYALEHHPGIAGQEAKRQESQLNLGRAQGAFWPVAALTAGIGQTSTDTGDFKSQSRNDSWGLTVSQNLWRGGQDQLTVNLQKIALDSAEMAKRQKQKSVEWKVRLAALVYNQAAMDLAIGVENLKISSEILELSRQKVQAGQTGKIDLMESHMQYSEAGNQISTAQIQLDRALSQLESEILLDDQDATKLSLADRLAPLRAKALPWPQKDRLKSLPFRSSPKLAPMDSAPMDSFDLQLKRQTLQQIEIEMQKNRRDRWLPSLDLNLSYERNASGTTTSPSPEAPQFSPTSTSKNTVLGARLNLTWTLWDYGKHYKVDETAAQWASLQTEEQELRKNLTITFQKSRKHLERLAQLFDQKNSTFTQAESLYQARLQLYRAGAIDIIVLTSAASERLRSLQGLYATMKELHTGWYHLQALEQGVTL